MKTIHKIKITITLLILAVGLVGWEVGPTIIEYGVEIKQLVVGDNNRFYASPSGSGLSSS
jgi:hypothetical protein